MITRFTIQAVALLALSVCGIAVSEPVLHYDFGAVSPFIVDRTGHANHGLAIGAQRVTHHGRSCLEMTKNGHVRMPEAELLLGQRAVRGTVQISVNPQFDPSQLLSGTWEGWVVLIYIQKTSHNGLPDGYNEIGLALHGGKLRAKIAGPDTATPFATIPSPLKKGEWTTLRLQWEPGRRALYVDDRLVAERNGPYEAPTLDMYPAYIGRHPVTGKWGFAGRVENVIICNDAACK